MTDRKTDRQTDKRTNISYDFYMLILVRKTDTMFFNCNLLIHENEAILSFIQSKLADLKNNECLT